MGQRALLNYKALGGYLCDQVGPVGHVVCHIRDVSLTLNPPTAGPSQARKERVGRHLAYMHNELQLASMPYIDIHI